MEQENPDTVLQQLSDTSAALTVGQQLLEQAINLQPYNAEFQQLQQSLDEQLNEYRPLQSQLLQEGLHQGDNYAIAKEAVALGAGLVSFLNNELVELGAENLLVQSYGAEAVANAQQKLTSLQQRLDQGYIVEDLEDKVTRKIIQNVLRDSGLERVSDETTILREIPMVGTKFKQTQRFIDQKLPAINKGDVVPDDTPLRQYIRGNPTQAAESYR